MGGEWLVELFVHFADVCQASKGCIDQATDKEYVAAHAAVLASLIVEPVRSSSCGGTERLTVKQLLHCQQPALTVSPEPKVLRYAYQCISYSRSHA